MAVHLILWRVIPLLVRQGLPFGRVITIPTADGRFTLAFITAFLLIAPVALVLLGGGTAQVGLKIRPDTWRWTALATGLLWLIFPPLNLIQGPARVAFAASMGVVTPTHFLWYSLVTACLIDGFREELYYRGFVQGVTTRVLPGGWGLLTAALFFASAHAGNDGTMAMRLTWVASSFVPGLCFALLTRASGSLWPAIIAHGASNSLMTGLTGVSMFAPGIYLPAARVELFGQLREGVGAGAGLLLGLVTGLVLTWTFFP
ncbi:MAG: CPBP family intramembrane glutamic endopeptidase [Symbiobacteriia bacterium]